MMAERVSRTLGSDPPEYVVAREHVMSASPTSTTRTVDITVAPRVVITFASGLLNRVLGERPTARDNAWRAVLADRERAAQREELAKVLRRAVPGGARKSRRARA